MLLDDPQRLATLDASGMLHCLHDLPEVALSSFEVGANHTLPITTPKLILICGMGGSAISGDLLRTLALATCSAPIMVHRGDRLPAFVDSACLVVVMSYSGNTAESLGCLHDALERQVPLVVISSGGEAAKLAHSQERSLLTIPGGKQPRAALGELFFSLLGLTSPLTGITEEDVRSTVRALVRLRHQIDVSVPLTDNPAKALANSQTAPGIGTGAVATFSL
jgi:glucose/mannose-6-phosphate isomerase